MEGFFNYHVSFFNILKHAHLLQSFQTCTFIQVLPSTCAFHSGSQGLASPPPFFLCLPPWVCQHCNTIMHSPPLFASLKLHQLYSSWSVMFAVEIPQYKASNSVSSLSTVFFSTSPICNIISRAQKRAFGWSFAKQKWEVGEKWRMEVCCPITF